MNNFEENKIKPVEVPTEKAKIDNPIVKPVDKVVSDNKNSSYIIISMVVGILVLIGAAYLGKGIMNKQNDEKIEFNNDQVEGQIVLNGNTCYNQKDYFVVTRAEVNDPGENILVKYKKDNERVFECNYLAEDGDFELLNTRDEKGNTINFTQYYSFIKDNFLIINLGTGTNREFQVYNLDTKERVFVDEYNSELEDLDLNDNVLTYWRTTNDIPNKENCSRIDEYKKMGGAKIEAKVLLNLTDLTKKEFSEFRCSYSE